MSRSIARAAVAGVRAAVVAALVAACGATTASVSPSAPASIGPPGGGPCSLVTDLTAAVGRPPIASPNAYAVGATERCMWVVARDPSRYVGVSVGPAINHASTIDAFGEGESVAGLGDDARWWPAARTLSVALGDRSLQVDLQLDEAMVTREVAEAVARQALEALGVAAGSR